MTEFFVYQERETERPTNTRDAETQTAPTTSNANGEVRAANAEVEDNINHTRVITTPSINSRISERSRIEPNRFNYYYSNGPTATSTGTNTDRGTATGSPDMILREGDQSTSRANDAGPNTDVFQRTSSSTTLDRELKRYMQVRESVGQSYQYYPGAEIIVYNFMDERSDFNGTNLIESTAHLIKGSLGAGVLGMHEAFMYGGLWTSLAATFIVGFMVAYSMYMLVRSAQTMYGRIRVPRLSYPDLAEVAAATGPWLCLRRHSKAFRYTVDVCLLLEMCGTCCIYQIMIAHTLKQVLEDAQLYTFTESELISFRIYILLVSPALLLLCLIRSLKFLAPFSMLADLFVGMCVLTTLYYSIRVADNIGERPAWKSIHGFIRFMGICMYCTSGSGVTLPIENNMNKPRYFSVILQCAMSVVIILTAMTGFFGYWGWGEECKSPITLHMPPNTFTTILQVLLLMMMSTTFAVQFWVPFRIVWHYISKRIKIYKRKQAMWERICRLIMATIVSGMSIAFPNLIPVMIFVGQFFLCFISFIFPAIIDHLVIWSGDANEEKTPWRICQNIFYVTVGVLLSCSAFYSVRS